MLLICLLPIVFGMYSGYKYCRKTDIKNELQYKKFYKTIEDYIYEWPKDEWCEKTLYGFVKELEKLPYKDKERTDVLYRKVAFKFKKEVPELQVV